MVSHSVPPGTYETETCLCQAQAAQPEEMEMATRHDRQSFCDSAASHHSITASQKVGCTTFDVNARSALSCQDRPCSDMLDQAVMDATLPDTKHRF